MRLPDGIQQAPTERRPPGRVVGGAGCGVGRPRLPSHHDEARRSRHTAKVTYYVHDKRPARVTEHHGAAPRAEYLNPDGTWADADHWKVTVEGTEAPQHIVLDYWQHHQPDVV